MIIEKIPKRIYKTIEDNFSGRDFFMATRYSEENIKKENEEYDKDGNLVYTFKVKDYFSNRNQTVNIRKEKDSSYSSRCTCYDYGIRHSCAHLPATFLTFHEELFALTKEQILARDKNLLKTYAKKVKKPQVKEELTLDFTFQIEEKRIYRNYYNYDDEKVLVIKLKMGKQKLYTITERKLNGILETIKNEEQFVIGKEFTFDPNKYYFNQEDQKIINFFIKRKNTGEKLLEIENIEEFFELFKNRKIKLEGFGIFDEIVEGFPYQTSLVQNENEYKLTLKEKGTTDLFDDKKYFVCAGKIYHTTEKVRKLLSELEDEDIKELRFEEEDLENFSSGLLPILKENLKLDEKLKTKLILDKPKAKLYFDLHGNFIICKVLFLYNNQEVNYFAQANNQVLRDYSFEGEVIDDLLSLGFILNVEKENIFLDDMDNIVQFLEEDLLKITEKYETYTSEKIKNVNIIKNNSIQTTFSIGKDNILSFHFDLGQASDKDLENILISMRKKKKYYRLKSGDILNLESKELEELEKLMNDLDLDGKENTGTIPKYRAIYLDSVKKEKYSIVKTDNLFDEFIKQFNEYKNSNLKFTKNEKEILRDYQQTGVKWLYNIYKCDLGGILADEMGLGKSIQVIYLMKKLLEEDKSAKFLIVVPTSLVYNWENEILKFAPDLKYEIITGNKEKRHELLQNQNKEVYITSYGLLREDIDFYEDFNFNVCIIDEAQNIKNPKAGISKTVKKIKARTHIALTGTPIENSIIELWSIFDFLMPGFLANETKFSSKYKVVEFDEESNKRLILLNQLITPFILRRKKKDVTKDLPDKIENNIYIDLSEKEKQLYASVVKDAKKKMEELIEDEGFQKAKFQILVLLTRLRQLCIDPKLVFENYVDERSSKIENLISVIEEVIANGHKILLFTSFKEALEIVKNEFEKRNISSYTIDGAVPSKKRMELVEKFNKDDTNVFLIMLKSGGTGLNLTSADVVIHLDLWWNPQAENQATDRTHRIGQKNTVEVIKLITRGTIEERILELQEKKKILSDKLIEGENRDQNMLNHLTEKELRTLLAFDNED